MLDLMQDQFHWFGMMRDAKAQIVGCDHYLQFTHKCQKRALENIQATHLLRSVHLDYLTTATTEGGKDVHISVIMDHFM